MWYRKLQRVGVLVEVGVGVGKVVEKQRIVLQSTSSSSSSSSFFLPLFPPAPPRDRLRRWSTADR